MRLSGYVMYDARQIANEFIRRGLDEGRPLTPLHIQKLVYFAHARFLVFHKAPLISQDFRAWQYGPVVRDIYDALKPYRARVVTEPISLPEQGLDSVQDYGAIDWCFRTYGHVDPFTLSALTHEPKGPWDRARKGGRTISNDMIREYYAEPWIAEERDFVARVSRHPTMVAEYLQSLDDFENGRYYTASGPEDMLEQIKRRRAERDTGGS